MDYFLHPKGKDSTINEPRKGTKDEPWKTLRFALSVQWREVNWRDSPLKAGDTLYLIGGRYYETYIQCEKAGTINAPIAIKNMPREEVIIDGSIPGLLHMEAWELIDVDRSVFRSKQPYEVPTRPGLAKQKGVVSGIFGYQNKKYTLAAYIAKETLFLDHEYPRTDGLWYVGPGVYYENDPEDVYHKHIFLRLQAPDPQAIGGQEFTFGQPGEKFDLGDFKVHVCFLSHDGVELRKYEHTHWSGLTFFNHGKRVFQQASPGFPLGNKFSNLKILTAGGGFALSGRQGETDGHLVFENIEFTTYLPPWIAFNEGKNSTDPAGSMAKRAINLTFHLTNIDIRDCYFHDCFDAILIQGRVNEEDKLLTRKVTIKNNRFERVMDDSITMGTDANDVEIAYNNFTNIGAAVSYQASGEPFPVEKIGTVFIHHNFILATPRFRGRPANVGDLPVYANYAPLATTHDRGFGEFLIPRKIYNNTVIVKRAAEGREVTITEGNAVRFTTPNYKGKRFLTEVLAHHQFRVSHNNPGRNLG